MSKNIQQVFTDNPIVTNQPTDLMYFGRSPYGIGDDAAMQFSSFSSQFGAPYTAAALTEVDDTNVTLTLGGSPSTALLQATSITAGWTGTLSGARGGSGVNNGINTATYAGNLNFASSFTTSGAFAVTQTYTGITNVTFPTSGTLATTSQLPTPAALTKVDDTNVTLTLGGTPTTALLQATSITAGWTGQLSLTRGGTNASLTASNGGIVWSNATQLQVLAGTATAGQMLRSGASVTPSWSTATFPSVATSAGTIMRADGTNWVATTATYPTTTTINQLLFSSANNVISEIATANRGILVTSNAGVPSMLGSAATTGQILQSNAAAAPSYSTTTYPATNAINTLLYASAANVMSALATANRGILVTSNTGVPSILGSAATTGQLLQSNAAAAPSYSTSTYPATNAINTILYASAANVMSALATANNGVLVTSGAGVPSISSTLPAAVINTSVLFTSIVIQQFTGSGTYTPTANMKFCIIECQGGGGGSGGSQTTTAVQCSASGGGGGGEYTRSRFTAASIGGSQVVTIGAAGAAGAAGNNAGGTGGTTSVGILITAVGGTGGSGGTGGTGTLSIPGQLGGTGVAVYTATAYNATSGNGGGSVLGFGGFITSRIAVAGTSSGIGGTAYGGGAGGSINTISQLDVAGRTGAAGLVIITEFI